MARGTGKFDFGFCTAYIYFIANQIGGINGVIPCIAGDGDSCDVKVIVRWWWMPICMLIFVPLVFVRKIQVFATTHLFADIMIILSLIVIFIYSGIDLSKNGANIGGVGPVGDLWADAIGFSVYTYEGIGVILL